MSREFEYIVDLANWQSETRTIIVHLLNDTPIEIIMPADTFLGASPTEEEIRVVALDIVESYRPEHQDMAVHLRFMAEKLNVILIPEEV
jgi:hypothetical protein